MTVFEEFMLLDGPSPMDIWLEAGFVQPLSRPALEMAVAALERRHPLLTARVEEQDGRRCWVGRSGRIPLVFLEEEDPWPRRPLDPMRGLGAVVYVRDRTLYIHVHHACCDGTGARAIFLDLASVYARDTCPGGPWSPPPRLDAERLLLRGQAGLAAPDVLAPGRWKQLKDIWRFLYPPPSPLAAQPGPGNWPPYSVRVLEPEETARVLEAARTSGGRGLHAKALSDWFGTLSAWQREHGKGRGGRLRVLVPWSLRTLADRRMPACNHMTFAFHDRDLGACGPDLSAGLHAEHEYIRRHRTDLDFLRGLELARSIGVLPIMLRLPFSMSTAVFTNMGVAKAGRGLPMTPEGVVIGDAIWRHGVGVAPVRTGTSAALGLCRVGGRLSVAVRCEPGRLGRDAERELLNDFIRRLGRMGKRPAGV